jgi:hypothetical protein
MEYKYSRVRYPDLLLVSISFLEFRLVIFEAKMKYKVVLRAPSASFT